MTTQEITANSLHVGSSVYTHNGEKIGKLRFVVLDPESEKVSHLVLERGMMLSRDVLAPVEVVGKLLHRGIFLTIDAAAVQELADFQEGRFLSGAGGGGGQGGPGGGGGGRKDRKRFRGGYRHG